MHKRRNTLHLQWSYAIAALTHWGPHLCFSELVIVDSGYGLLASHYLNQCWNVAKGARVNKTFWNLNLNTIIFIQEYWNVVCKMPLCYGLIALTCWVPLHAQVIAKDMEQFGLQSVVSSCFKVQTSLSSQATCLHSKLVRYLEVCRPFSMTSSVYRVWSKSPKRNLL